ncbi:DUF4079 domain-containing protein [Planktothrix sp. FACHB-1355]|uniref:DUF4079 domain-containing protein n=1 Tax=Aerosakkonema funiforme FACHB-1375 TaxID=2949571 RepID=A0A926VEW5_9CYAN|nr:MULTISPECIES: DUF4079 domain-containing protein [Oscillatoriales]MBD2182443.1 DUF4079 domain-containing protein [Aerosakkonema funiforme FACHB-1375]MBD3561553.1 DUF4079 domain-containing protein [Planktothrix sp. FACHB-1355]
MEFQDFLALIHPAIAVVIVFPLIGTVVNFAWQTRVRRLQTAAKDKSKIPSSVGPEHIKMGRWLTGWVVGLTLVGLAYHIVEHILSDRTWTKAPLQVAFILLMFLDTIAALVLLYLAKQKIWRGLFATLTGMGIVLLGCQDGVFRRTNEWYWSHYYIGITATLLMIFSLAIVQDIYKDKSNRWRTFHIILNSFALLLFIGQGLTGTRDLLEIPLHWQKTYIFSCDFNNKTCPQAVPPSEDTR